MIKLEKYNEFLDAFKYACLESKEKELFVINCEIIEQSLNPFNYDISEIHLSDNFEMENDFSTEEGFGCEENDYMDSSLKLIESNVNNMSNSYHDVSKYEIIYEIEFIFNEKDYHNIYYIVNNMSQIILNAKSEFLSNIYQINNIQDKRHFISFIGEDFLKVYTDYFRLYNFLLSEHIYLFTISKNLPIVYTKTVSLYLMNICYNMLQEWVNFIYKILLSYNIKMTTIGEKIRAYIDGSFDYLRIFLLYEFAEPINILNSGLKTEFKEPSKYDSIMKLKKMRGFFDENGYPYSKTLKSEISSFLHFLNDYNFFKEKYSKTKQLHDIGFKYYDLKPDTMNHPKATDIFRFILDEVKP